MGELGNREHFRELLNAFMAKKGLRTTRQRDSFGNMDRIVQPFEHGQLCAME